jgi:peptidyl-tRNA hydrolase, PTH1 family
MEIQSRLIIGLGNPGVRYERTRHNLGFLVVRNYAEKKGWRFKKESKVLGELASGKIDKDFVLLLLPMTYVNLSGNAVKKTVDYYKISFKEADQLLVIVDDVYLPFGTMRLRSKGSTGGHNGLKSIEQQLGSHEYTRLRMGVGPKSLNALPDGRERFLEDYVLSSFTTEEESSLSKFIDNATQVIDCWLAQGFDSAMHEVGKLRIQL